MRPNLRLLDGAAADLGRFGRIDRRCDHVPFWVDQLRKTFSVILGRSRTRKDLELFVEALLEADGGIVDVDAVLRLQQFRQVRQGL